MKNVTVYNITKTKIQKQNVHRLIEIITKKLEITINSLEINIVSESVITEINKKYLKHNYATDVIAFNYSGESNNLDGEIFICNKVAFENARKFKVKFESEFRRLIIHALLHLIGYDDKTSSSKRKMKGQENKLLLSIKRFGKITE
jgi:rRNA maturation RNase YbeY